MNTRTKLYRNMILAAANLASETNTQLEAKGITKVKAIANKSNINIVQYYPSFGFAKNPYVAVSGFDDGRWTVWSLRTSVNCLVDNIQNLGAKLLEAALLEVATL
ncbi:MAG TPA: hypothetical protein VGK87_12140 [Anaerolineae bacterium]|jgi:hypothetical protein